MILTFLGALRSVLASAFHSLVHTGGIQNTANDGIAEVHVLYAAAAENDDGVFLEGVADAGNVGRHFHAVSQTDAGDFSDGGVRLSRGFGCNLGANAAFERSVKKNGVVFQYVERARQSRRL